MWNFGLPPGAGNFLCFTVHDNGSKKEVKVERMEALEMTCTEGTPDRC